MRHLHRPGWRAVAAALALTVIAAWVLSPLGASTALAAQQVIENVRVVNDLDGSLGSPTEVAKVGDELRFLIGVANESPFWLRDIRIQAPMVGLVWEVGSDLAPRTPAGALSALIGRSYTVTEADLPGPVVNTVTVTAVLDRGEFGGDLPLEIVVTESIPIAALSLTKSAEPSEVELGEEVTYTFTVTNTGSVPLQTVTILDPALDHFGVNFGTIHPGDSRSQDWAYTPQAGDFVEGAFVNVATATGYYTLPSDGSQHPVEDQATATVTLKPADSGGDDGNGDEVGDGGDAGNDGEGGNDGGNDGDTPPPPPRPDRTPRVDLAVAKTVDDPTAAEGAEVTFTVTVTNEGPDDAQDVTVSDLLPEGLTYVDHSASQGSYDPGAGEWQVGDLADDDSATLTLRAVVDPGTAGRILTNQATLTGSEPADRDPSNNSDSAAVAPPPPPIVVEEEPLAAAPPPLPVTGGPTALLLISGFLSLAAGLYLRRFR